MPVPLTLSPLSSNAFCTCAAVAPPPPMPDSVITGAEDSITELSALANSGPGIAEATEAAAACAEVPIAGLTSDAVWGVWYPAASCDGSATAGAETPKSECATKVERPEEAAGAATPTKVSGSEDDAGTSAVVPSVSASAGWLLWKRK